MQLDKSDVDEAPILLTLFVLISEVSVIRENKRAQVGSFNSAAVFEYSCKGKQQAKVCGKKKGPQSRR